MVARVLRALLLFGPKLFFLLIVFFVAGLFFVFDFVWRGEAFVVAFEALAEDPELNAIHGGISRGLSFSCVTSLSAAFALICGVSSSSSLASLVGADDDDTPTLRKFAALLHAVIAAAPLLTDIFVGHSCELDTFPPTSALFAAVPGNSASAGGCGEGVVKLGGA